MKLASLVSVALAAFSVGCALGDPADPGGRDTRGTGDETSTSTPSPVGVGAAPTPEKPAAPATGFATAAEQVAAGKAVFSRSCIGCHGAAGQGGRGPRLVGLAQGALSGFANADEVARFISANMPVQNATEAYAVAAWLMDENGVETDDRVLDPTVAPTVALR